MVRPSNSDDEDDAPRDIGQVHRLLLALVVERGELLLADHRGELSLAEKSAAASEAKAVGVELGPLARRR